MVKVSLKKLHLNGNMKDRNQPGKPMATPFQPAATATAKVLKGPFFLNRKKAGKVEGTGRR